MGWFACGLPGEGPCTRNATGPGKALARTQSRVNAVHSAGSCPSDTGSTP